MKFKILSILSFITWSNLMFAGTVARVPPTSTPSTGGTATITKEWKGFWLEQEDFDTATGWYCLPAGSNGWMPATSGIVSFKLDTDVTTSVADCYGTDLRTWTEDTMSSPMFMDHVKPAGIKWTAKSFDCIVIGPAATTASSDENVEFKLGWRDKDTSTVDTNTMQFASDSALGTVTTQAVNFEIGTESTAAGMVLMVHTDDDGDTAPFDRFNVMCTAKIEVE